MNRQRIPFNNNLDVNEPTISFAGCGFLGIYHVGVATCLKEYAPHLISGKLTGASAGALVACALMSGCCLGECTSFTLRAASMARQSSIGPLHPNFNAIKLLEDGLKEILPDNAHLICTGKLFISLTRVKDKKNVIVSSFESKSDLIQALICSAFVPFYCGMLPPKFRGEYYVDGGLTINIPIFDDNTIIVSPFAGESDICPKDVTSNFMFMHLAKTSIQFTCSNIYRLSHALFPPHPNILSDMCRQGFDDALNFLQRNNYIICSKHLKVKGTCIFSSFKEENENETGDEESYADFHNDNDEEFTSIDDHDSNDCSDCKNKQRIAFLENLPPIVVHALQNACDSVNKSFFAPLYGTKLYKMAALMTWPLLLPFDQLLSFGDKCLKWTPFLSDEAHLFISEFMVLLRNFITIFQSGGHRYSARFSCQLAVSELESQPLSASVNVGGGGGRQRKDTIRRSSVTSMDSYCTNSEQTKGGLHNMELEFKACSRINSNENIAESCSNNDLDRLPDVLQDVLVKEREENMKQLELKNRDPNLCDSFENCLNIDEEMDAILAYHYLDCGTVKFQQIFRVHTDLDE